MRISFLSIAVLLFVALGNTSCEKTSDPSGLGNEDLLTETEKADLLFMREEEKLARDVYSYLYDKYNRLIFKNISNSEQKHMDAILALIEYYGIEDPASSQPGIFNNEDLQKVYDDLILAGEASLESALKVGATIEDLDIKDLNLALETTSRNDIIKVYEKLKCGSENHLRAFMGQIKDLGADYVPQHIDQDLFETIINGEHAHCGA
jgi:hypothetical protein